MNDQKNKYAELILKLTLSGLPPSLQDYIISNLEQLNSANVDYIIGVLNELAEAEYKYIAATEKYQEFFNRLSEEIKQKLNLETEKIRQELLVELMKNPPQA